MQIGGILPTCSKLFARQIKGVDGNTLTGFNFQILNLEKRSQAVVQRKANNLSIFTRKYKLTKYLYGKVNRHENKII